MNPIPEPMEGAPALRQLTTYDLFEIAAKAQQLCDLLLERKQPAWLLELIHDLRGDTLVAVEKTPTVLH